MANVRMLSIKEFADFTDLSEPTLRYYDTIGLLSPALRGKNNYRYYEPFQIITASFIKVLTKLDMPLSTIRELNKGRSPQALLALLGQQQQVLNRQLFDLQMAYSLIQTYRHNIQTGMLAHEREISVQELDEIHIILGPPTDFSGGRSFFKPFMDFYNLRHESKINMHFPVGAYHESMDSFMGAPAQPDRFFSLDPHGHGKRAAGQYLVAYANGGYGEFGDLPQRMEAYAKTQDLAFQGPVYVIYLLNEVSVKDPSDYLAQVVAGIAQNGG